MRNPVDEATYAMSDKSAVCFFDCLIPKLPGYMKRKRSDSDDSTTSYVHKDDHYNALAMKDAEMKIKDEKIAELETELKIVDWYVEVFEDGLDASKLLRQYTEVKKERDKWDSEAEKYKEMYWTTKTKLK